MIDDRGAAAERTVLAWQRTALASVVLAGAVVRLVVSALPLGGAVLVALALGLAGLLGGALSLVRAGNLRAFGLAAGSLTATVAAGIAVVAIAVALMALIVGVTADGLFEL